MAGVTLLVCSVTVAGPPSAETASALRVQQREVEDPRAGGLEEALRHAPRAGLEEPFVVIQPGTEIYRRMVQGSMPRKALRAYLWRLHRRRAILRLPPTTWAEADQWQRDGLVPALDVKTVMAHVRQHGQWPSASLTTDVERREGLQIELSIPLALPHGLPPVRTIRIVPTQHNVFDASQTFSGNFRGALKALAQRRLAADGSQRLLQEIEQYVRQGYLGILGVPYVIPDALAARAFSRTWGLALLADRVASEAEVEQATAALATSGALAPPPPAVDASAYAARIARAANAIREVASDAHGTLKKQLDQRLTPFTAPDPQALMAIRRRLRVLDSTRPGELERWLKQQFPPDRAVDAAQAREALITERDALARAIAAAPVVERPMMPLARHVIQMERGLPAEASQGVPLADDAQTVIANAPDALASLLATLSYHGLTHDPSVLQRLDAVVQRAQRVLRTGQPEDPGAQQALQRWQALAVALLSAGKRLTVPTAEAFFNMPGVLERDLWYWVAFGLLGQDQIHLLRPDQFSVSSWAGGGLLFLMASPGGQSSFPLEPFETQKPATAMVRAVLDMAQELNDPSRVALEREHAQAACLQLAGALRRRLPPDDLKIRLLLHYPDAVWNVRAVFAHLAAALADQVGCARTAARFAAEAETRYQEARRHHATVWEPSLPSLESLQRRRAVEAARTADLVQRVERGERADEVSPAELVAIIGRLGSGVEYHLVAILPIHHGTAGHRWVWFDGAWRSISSAETDIQAFIREQLRKIAVQAARVHGMGMNDMASDLPEVTARADGQALEVIYPSLDAQTLTQMVESQQQLGPSGTVWCTVQPMDPTNGPRQVRVEIAAASTPVPAAAGIEEGALFTRWGRPIRWPQELFDPGNDGAFKLLVVAWLMDRPSSATPELEAAVNGAIRAVVTCRNPLGDSSNANVVGAVWVALGRPVDTALGTAVRLAEAMKAGIFSAASDPRDALKRLQRGMPTAALALNNIWERGTKYQDLVAPVRAALARVVTVQRVLAGLQSPAVRQQAEALRTLRTWLLWLRWPWFRGVPDAIERQAEALAAAVIHLKQSPNGEVAEQAGRVNRLMDRRPQVFRPVTPVAGAVSLPPEVVRARLTAVRFVVKALEAALHEGRDDTMAEAFGHIARDPRSADAGLANARALETLLGVDDSKLPLRRWLPYDQALLTWTPRILRILEKHLAAGGPIDPEAIYQHLENSVASLRQDRDEHTLAPDDIPRVAARLAAWDSERAWSTPVARAAAFEALIARLTAHVGLAAGLEEDRAAVMDRLDDAVRQTLEHLKTRWQA